MAHPSSFKSLTTDLQWNINSNLSIDEKYDTLANLFYKIITLRASLETIVFNNFYAQYKYVVTHTNLSTSDRKNLDSYRRLIKHNGQEHLINETCCHQASQIIGLLLKAIDNTVDISFLYNANVDYNNQYFSELLPRRNYETIKDIKVLCTYCSPLAVDGNSFNIKGYDLEDSEGELEIHIKNEAFTNFTYLHELVLPYTIINFQQLEITTPLNYTNTYETLITIEPDYLLDATDIAECFQQKGSNYELFFLKKLLPDLPGSAALKGSIIGYYLDDMIRGGTNNSDYIFLKAQKENALRAAQLGQQELHIVKRSIENEHLQNISALVAREAIKKLWIEPTYFSSEFGLQGRIDLLTMEDYIEARNVLELKSGSPTNPAYSTAWAAHQMQVVCYDMMLSSTYGASRNGTNSIFYSKCQISPRRNIVSEIREKQALLQTRNKIVSNIYKLGQNDFSVLNKIKQTGIEYIPPYSIGTLEKFTEYYRIDTASGIFYNEMLAFTLRELLNTKIGNLIEAEYEEKQNGFASLWLDDLLTKKQHFEIVYDMEVTHIDKENGCIHLQLFKDIPHAFRKADLVLLYPKTGIGYKPLSQHILKGSLKEISIDQLVVSLFNKQTDYSFIETHSLWAIEPDIFERNYWSIIAGLFNFLTCDIHRKRLLFGVKEPSYNNIYFYNDKLTDVENRCLCDALNAKDYYLLQGPPGTGKTSTFLINYLRELLKKSDNKVIILAFTNKAVQKICDNLKNPRTGAPIPYIRIGSKHVEDENLFTRLCKDDNPDNWRKLLEQNRVLVSTVTSFQNNILLLKQFMPFEQVIVDEASQLTEADIAGVLSIFSKFVLIGDHKQLPAVITQREQYCLIKSKDLHSFCIIDFRISLFERLFINAQQKGWSHCYGQLQDHYRMHKDIATLISSHYDKPLKAYSPTQNTDTSPYQLDTMHPLHNLTSGRIVFLETPPDRTPKRNIYEAKLAAWIAENLINAGKFKASEVGIVVPFRAQGVEIKKYIKSESLRQVLLIDTIERYQGDEQELIIFTTTVTSPSQLHNIQSIASQDIKKTDRKLLVTLSRAKTQVLILGNSDILQSVTDYRNILKHVHQNGTYLNRNWTDKILRIINE